MILLMTGLPYRRKVGKNAALMSWNVFQITFLNMFFPPEIKQAKVENFMNLK